MTDKTPDRAWRIIYSDDKDTWPEPGQLCSVLVDKEAQPMIFICEGCDVEVDIIMDCGFVTVAGSEHSLALGPCTKEHARFGNVVWKPLDGEVKPAKWKIYTGLIKTEREVRLEKTMQKAHDHLMNLQPHIGQLPKYCRPFIDVYVNEAMAILEQDNG